MITVLFATHNGENTLPVMLDNFCKLEAPKNGWEIIAVDNASNDNTAAIIKSYIDRLPITYIYEAQAGKNNALNIGLTVAKGELVVLTDDDIIPQSTWLTQWENCTNSHPDYAVFGGRIQAKWPRQPEKWILDYVSLGITYAISPDKTEEGETNPYMIWGPNMVIRKEIFDLGFRFNDSVGPNGMNYIMGSETEFTARLYQEGFKPWFCNKAIVQHIIREHQLSKDWIIKRAFRYGRSLYMDEVKTFDKNLPLIYGVPRWKFRGFISTYIKYIMSFLSFNNKNKFQSAWEISSLRGYVSEALNQRNI